MKINTLASIREVLEHAQTLRDNGITTIEELDNVAQDNKKWEALKERLEWTQREAEQIQMELAKLKGVKFPLDDIFTKPGRIIPAGHTEKVWGLAVNENGEMIASGDNQGKLLISNMKGEVATT